MAMRVCMWGKSGEVRKFLSFWRDLSIITSILIIIALILPATIISRLNFQGYQRLTLKNIVIRHSFKLPWLWIIALSNLFLYNRIAERQKASSYYLFRILISRKVDFLKWGSNGWELASRAGCGVALLAEISRIFAQRPHQHARQVIIINSHI